jgi:CBS domain-containing protein/sporulation protein YlmC with PRC-barrel domain
MPFVSDLLGKPVVDVDGVSVGRLEDLIAHVGAGILHPEIVGLVVKSGRDQRVLPFGEVAVLTAPAVSLAKRRQEVGSYSPIEGDMRLSSDILDKQIIDTNGVRVVRVNDLELARVNSHYYIANVDVGSLGLLRRLGLASAIQKLNRRLGRDVTGGMISWNQIELLPGDQPMRLKVSGEKISDLHPADLAEIISDLSRPESKKLLEALDVKQLADTLEEVEPDFQASLVETMPDEKVADVLEEMAPDEAADLLAELPRDRSRELLKLMQVDEAADVRRLLAYPEDSVGGIMTTDFVSLPPDLTAAQAIQRLRELADEVETILYVYVTDSANRLLGVFSLHDLVMAKPGTRVSDFMQRRFVSVTPRDSQDTVAQAIAKYNLSAIPVVDDQMRLQGIVTADDALDKILPTKWKKRLPRLYH